MMNWILKYYSKENDIILDPTMGGGSMGAACKEMNREFIGFEMDEEIYKCACERLEYDIESLAYVFRYDDLELIESVLNDFDLLFFSN